MDKISLTAKSSSLACCSMNPVTANVLEGWVALVAGMLYKAWIQAGVTMKLHVSGMSSDETLTSELMGILRGVEKTGPRGEWSGKLIG